MTTPDFLDPDNAIAVIRGTSNTIALTLSDPEREDPETEDPFLKDRILLTGASIYFSVKKDIRDRTPLIQKTSAILSEVTIIEERRGTAEIYLLPADTTHLDVGKYVFDIWVILADGKRHCAVPPSTFEILPSVTRLL